MKMSSVEECSGMAGSQHLRSDGLWQQCRGVQKIKLSEVGGHGFRDSNLTYV